MIAGWANISQATTGTGVLVPGIDRNQTRYKVGTTQRQDRLLRDVQVGLVDMDYQARVALVVSAEVLIQPPHHVRV